MNIFLSKSYTEKKASVVAANQVFVVVTKSTDTASTVSASAKLAAMEVANMMPPSVAELTAVLAASVSKRSGILVSLKVKTWIDRVFWLNLYLFMSLELISRRKWPPGIEAAISRVIPSNRS
jgi:hypothetical protein